MTGEPRPVEEIHGDLVTMGEPPTVYRRFAVGDEFRRDDVCERLLDDVEPLLDRLAAADRENAELRGEVERLEARLVRADEARRRIERERDDLRAQLAAAQAQMAEAREHAACAEAALEVVGEYREAAEARLEAVRAVMNHPDVRCLCGHESRLHAADGERRCTETADRASWHCPCRTFHPTSIPMSLLDAALSAAPQPEPDVRAAYSESLRRLGRADLVTEPPASDEPARCEHDPRCSLNGAAAAGCHCVWHNGRHMACYPSCHAGGGCVEGFPVPAASGTPDGSA